MALPKASVSRQAPRSRPAPAAKHWSVDVDSDSLENDGLEETEEPAPKPTIPKPPRLTVNGVAVKRLQIDFGSNATAFHPTGSVMERSWDQYDDGPDKDKYSRPRAFCNAQIEVDVSKGFMDVIVHWPDSPGVSRIVQSIAYLSYEA